MSGPGVAEAAAGTGELPPGVWECTHCKDPVVIRVIRDGRRWPFDRALVEAADVAEDLRFVPTRAGGVIVMVPVSDVSERRLQGVRWFARRHTCVQWLMAQRAQLEAARDQDGGFADALLQLLTRLAPED